MNKLNYASCERTLTTLCVAAAFPKKTISLVMWVKIENIVSAFVAPQVAYLVAHRVTTLPYLFKVGFSC